MISDIRYVKYEKYDWRYIINSNVSHLPAAVDAIVVHTNSVTVINHVNNVIGVLINVILQAIFTTGVLTWQIMRVPLKSPYFSKKS